MANLKKSDLIKILVEEYGYEKEDIKLLTNAKLQGLINQEKTDAEELESSNNRVVSKKSKIDDNTRIAIMNGLNGGVFYHSERTNTVWEFGHFGQQDYMTYGDLVALRNKYPTYLYDGWFVVLDKEVQDEFHLTGVYKNILTPDNVEEVFSMDINRLDAFVNALPEGHKRTFVGIAKNKYENKTLSDLRIIRYIEEKFNFSFDDNAPLNDVVSTATKKNDVIYVSKV